MYFCAHAYSVNHWAFLFRSKVTKSIVAGFGWKARSTVKLVSGILTRVFPILRKIRKYPTVLISQSEIYWHMNSYNDLLVKEQLYCLCNFVPDADPLFNVSKSLVQWLSSVDVICENNNDSISILGPNMSFLITQ